MRHSTPLRNSPLLLAQWLACSNRARRLAGYARRNRWLLPAVLVSVVALGAFIVALAQGYLTHSMFESAYEQRFLVAAIGGVYAVLFVLRRRVHVNEGNARSWPRAAPLPSSQWRNDLFVRICGPLLLQWSVLSFVAIVSAMFANTTRGVPIVGWLSGGLGTGLLLGVLWPRRFVQQKSADSRFVPKVRANPFRPSLAGLSRWPVAKALAWHRPENSRFLFVIAALSVPMGTSALMGLAIIAVWSLASYLAALARSVPQVAREASLWLKPTLLPLLPFIWAVMKRAMLHQLLGTIVLSAVFVAVGAEVVAAAYCAVLWLAGSAMSGVVTIRMSFLSRSSIPSLVASTVMFAVAEWRAKGCGLVLVVFVTALYCRGVSRARA